MGYADWHFFWKDFEENKKFRRLIIRSIIIIIVIFCILFIWFGIRERKKEAVEVVFLEYTLPQIAPPLTEKSLDEAILKTIKMLKSKDNALYEDFVAMRKNYEVYLSNNKQACVLDEDKVYEQKKTNSHLDGLGGILAKDNPIAKGFYRIKNPYDDTLRAIEEMQKSEKVRANTMKYFPLPPTDTIQYFCVK